MKHILTLFIILMGLLPAVTSAVEIDVPRGDRPVVPNYGDFVRIPGTQGHDLYTVVVPSIFDIIFGTLGTLGLILLFVGGARAVMSRGNADEFKKAIMNIVFIALGMIIMGLAYTIVRMVVNITYG